MQAVILLGGQGTRLRTLHPDVPKALAPVAGRPFLDWQYDWLTRGGVTSIHLAAGYKADQIQTWAATRAHVTVSCEPEPRGTGGALAYVQPFIQSEPFIVVNGDSLSPALDFQRLISSHQNRSNHGRCLTMAVARMEQAGRYGTVKFNEEGCITHFQEKADRENGWVNAGVYVLSRDVLDHIPSDQSYSLEHDLFPGLSEEHRIFAFPVDPPMLDMGTPEGLRVMTAYLETRDL